MGTSVASDCQKCQYYAQCCKKSNSYLRKIDICTHCLHCRKFSNITVNDESGPASAILLGFCTPCTLLQICEISHKQHFRYNAMRNTLSDTSLILLLVLFLYFYCNKSHQKYFSHFLLVVYGRLTIILSASKSIRCFDFCLPIWTKTENVPFRCLKIQSRKRQTKLSKHRVRSKRSIVLCSCAHVSRVTGKKVLNFLFFFLKKIQHVEHNTSDRAAVLSQIVRFEWVFLQIYALTAFISWARMNVSTLVAERQWMIARKFCAFEHYIYSHSKSSSATNLYSFL